MRRGLVAGLVALAGGATVVLAATRDLEDAPSGSAARTDRWSALQPAKLARTEVGAARIGRFAYVVGGFERKSGETTAAVERYDLREDRWKRVRSMPLRLNHPAATAYKGRLYVLGGYTSRGALRDETAALLRYEPKRDRWKRLDDAPTKRGALALGALRGRLYAAGGANAADGALDLLEIYDLKERRWSRGPDMALSREHLAGTVAGGYFYVLAGRAAGRGNFTIAERYDPKRNSWERLPEMRKSRGGIAAAAVGKRVVVFGGEESAGTIAEVELYDPAKRRWRPLPELRTPRHGLGGVSLGKRVYAIEGGPEPGFHFSRAIEALDIR